jgi:hypothetical protein
VISTVAEACPVGDAATAGDAVEVGDAAKVGDAVEAGDAAKVGDEAGVAVAGGWVGVDGGATLQSCASKSAFEAEYREETEPEMLICLRTPLGHI